ncbi:hypothetical protein [Clostridium frigidicarnis]|uniref:Uncharacterized protein n=1 Tax=Clostridium frigidicarnis TaxID=84698 RepID=A0A1I0ZZW5_9CLOT|nr:hypothetical protein [Clostridium frigidicarnis]SFB29848.1 hypothetical protein SAMN04488528_102632 [Clostridium frigidicarnis]
MNKKIILAISFITILLLVPIFSIEGMIPWIIFLIFSRRIIKVIKSEELMKDILPKCIGYTVICICLGLGFNLLIQEGTQLIISKLL